MKLITFAREPGGKEEVGILRAGDAVLPVGDAGFDYESMNDLILRAGAAELDALRRAEGPLLPLSQVTLLAPIPRPLQDVLCLGLNYTEHAEEAFGYSS